MAYTFLATYENIFTGQSREFAIIINNPELTEKEYYIGAMEMAYDNIDENELLSLIEFISC